MALNKDAVALAAKINKKLGEDAILVASEMVIPKQFPSGSLTLDVSLGGGWPGNQWVEILGHESHGKTTVVLKTVAANQAIDPDFTTLWVAGEHFDKAWAETLGVDLGRVIVCETQDMVVAYETMLAYAESRTVDCIVLDSYPALITPEEEEKGLDEAVVAIGARLTGKFFRKAGSATRRSMTDENDKPILGMIINQWRDMIGGWSPAGTPKTSPGGNAKNYAYYVRVDVKRDEWIQEGKTPVGQTIKVTTLKNKQARPRQVASFDFYFAEAPEHGFHAGEYDTVKETVLLGLLYGLIERRGAYFTYGDERVQGRDNMLQAFREQPDLLASLDAEVRQIGRTGELVEDAVTSAEKTGKRVVKRSASDSGSEA